MFCATHELGLRGHDETVESLNRGVFLDLLDIMAETDTILHQHLASSTVAKYTSNNSQNELLECMYNVYREHVTEEIKSSKFLALQADEATDASHKSQLVIVFRYLIGTIPVERFIEFVDIKDRSAVGLASTLKTALEPFEAKTKLVSQTFDGAAVMSGKVSGVQTLMKQDYPHAHFSTAMLISVLKEK